MQCSSRKAAATHSRRLRSICRIMEATGKTIHMFYPGKVRCLRMARHPTMVVALSEGRANCRMAMQRTMFQMAGVHATAVAVQEALMMEVKDALIPRGGQEGTPVATVAGLRAKPYLDKARTTGEEVLPTTLPLPELEATVMLRSLLALLVQRREMEELATEPILVAM